MVLFCMGEVGIVGEVFVDLVVALLLMNFSNYKRGGDAVRPLIITAPRHPSKRRSIVRLATPGVSAMHIKFVKLKVHNPKTIIHFARVPNVRVGTLYSVHRRYIRGTRGVLGRTNLPRTVACCNSRGS